MTILLMLLTQVPLFLINAFNQVTSSLLIIEHSLMRQVTPLSHFNSQTIGAEVAVGTLSNA